MIYFEMRLHELISPIYINHTIFSRSHISCQSIIIIMETHNRHDHHEITNHTDDEENYFFAMQMAGSVALPWTIKAAVDLEVFDILSKAGPEEYLSASAIASHFSTKNPDAAQALDRILCLLVSHSLLTCKPVTLESGHVERRYGLAERSKYLAKAEDGVSLSWFMLLGQHQEFFSAWSHLKDAVLEGGDVPVFDKVNGYSVFDYYYYRRNPNVGKTFNSSLHSMTSIIMEKMVEIYKGFEGLKSLVDIGGGTGTAISYIKRKYPSIKAINFDLPSVVEHAPQIPGVEHLGGDMFASIPKAEAVFMKSVIHNWSDEHCLKLLKNCYEALPDHGKVIIMDLVSPQVPKPNSSMRNFYQSDVFMMALMQGGKERDEENLNVLAKEAGFALVKVVCYAYGHWVVELHKSA
ncbi:hypothetical protein Scep_025204 [Stephania cephalantha]|uniref:Uncharacterized protein n=1 Tax=Stephania cephalantha TaxID=152367 RepID=A0AAP0HS99_9MAGN